MTPDQQAKALALGWAALGLTIILLLHEYALGGIILVMGLVWVGFLWERDQREHRALLAARDARRAARAQEKADTSYGVAPDEYERPDYGR